VLLRSIVKEWCEAVMWKGAVEDFCGGEMNWSPWSRRVKEWCEGVVLRSGVKERSEV
jgi:hypothetical protein